MIRINRRGQTLVESLGALWLLLILFFSIFYIFLIGIDKIRSLDTVYHLARIQEVHPTDGLTLNFLPAVVQCFGLRPYWTNIDAQESSGPPISEVTFRFIHNFSPFAFLPPHKSIMRVAQANPDYLLKSYPGATEDINEPGIGPKLLEEWLFLEAQAQMPAQATQVMDLAEVTAAKIEEELP